MSEYSAELRLKEPLTKEDWEIIADADFKHTTKVIFTTPHCGEVEFVKVVRCKDCRWKEQEQPGMVYCPATVGGWVDEDWFCKGGERSEE